jgi:hypothetical protein
MAVGARWQLTDPEFEEETTAIYCHSKAKKPLKMAKNGCFGVTGGALFQGLFYCVSRSV